MNIADMIAYATHDVEDAIEARLREPKVVEDQRLWKRVCNSQRVRLNHLGRRPSVLALRETLIRNVIEETRSNRLIGANNPADVREHADPIVKFSRDVEREVNEFVDALTKKVYRDPWVARMDSNGKRTLKALFEQFVANPNLLPTHTRERIGDGDLHWGVRDFVSGMTDRHAIEMYKSIFDPEGWSLSLTS